MIPKLAGTCVLWRYKETGSPESFEVLMIKRTNTLLFLPGHHAFPGGSIEDTDDPSIVVGDTPQKIKRALIGALRETFEEVGYLPFSFESVNKRLELYKSKNPSEIFQYLIKSETFKLDIKNYPFSGPWITPPGYPLRFETYFFFIEWKDVYTVFDISSPKEVELVEWVKPAEILKRWHKREISLSTPVAYILEHLSRFPVEKAIAELKVIPWTDEKYSYFHPRAGIHIFPLPCPKETFFNNVNCVIVGEKELLIIDPGIGDTESIRELLYWLEHLIKLGSNFVGITYTHLHKDHAGSIDLISNYLKVPIIHPNKLFSDIPKTLGRYPSIQLDKEEYPWIINILLTPGHTPIHYSYYELTTKTLIAGDMVSAEGPVVVNPNESGDMGKYMESLQLLSELDIDLLIPGHGVPFFFVKGNQVISNLIAHRKQREDKIITALNKGISSFHELLSLVYDDVPQSRLELAKQQLRAHLIHLRTKGMPLSISDDEFQQWY